MRSSNKTKTSWDLVNKFTNRSKNGNMNIKLRVDNKITESPTEVANTFNHFFHDAPLTISKNIPDLHLTNEHFLSNTESIFLFPFTSLEILHLFDNLKNKCSSGPDNIACNIFKKSKFFIVDIITHLFNCSLQEGTFPTCFKQCEVIPIYKKGDSDNPANYRPISLTSCLGKLLEYAMLVRLTPFLMKHKIISENQHGFRTGKSTTSAVEAMYCEILHQLENKQVPIGVFCDLSRAFDCVDHHLLVGKLERVGIRGVALKWISSYLSNRYHYVRITIARNMENTTYTSGILPMTVGVPQGAILSPLLFTVFINDIIAFLKNYFIILYADDTTAVVYGSILDIETKTNTMLRELNHWFLANNLHLNTSKTNYMSFSCAASNLPPRLNVEVGGVSLDQVTSTKILGIYLQCNLKWDMHIEQLNSTISRSIFKLRCLKDNVDFGVLRMVYYADIETRLRYGIILWGSSPAAAKTLILQKRAIRTMCGAAQLDSCRPFFRELKFLTLFCLYILEISCHVHKRKNLLIASNNVEHNYDMRSTSIHLPGHRLSLTSNSLTCLSLKIYNKLPSTLKNLPFSTFKKSLKAYLLEHPYYSINEFFKDKDIYSL